jgi:hypothetical protein
MCSPDTDSTPCSADERPARRDDRQIRSEPAHAVLVLAQQQPLKQDDRCARRCTMLTARPSARTTR